MSRGSSGGMTSVEGTKDDDEALAARVEAKLVATWDELVGALMAGLLQFVAYQRLDPDDLRDRVEGIAILFRATVVSSAEGLGPALRGRLVAFYRERVRLGIAIHDLLRAIDAALDVGNQHLRQVERELHLRTPGATAFMDGAFSRLQHLGHELREAAGEAAALEAAAHAPAGFVDRVIDAPAGPAVRRDALDLDLPVDGPCWGLLVVATRRGTPDTLAPVFSRLLAAVPGARASEPRSHPAGHIAVLVPVEDAGGWTELVATAQEVASTEHTILLADDRPCALSELCDSYGEMRAALRFIGVLPHATNRAVLALYQSVEALGYVGRATLFQEVLGSLVGTKHAAEVFPTLDVHVARAVTQRGVATHLGMTHSAVARRINTWLREATGLDWEHPLENHAIAMAVICRWFQAAYFPKYDEEAWGPRPDLGSLGA